MAFKTAVVMDVGDEAGCSGTSWLCTSRELAARTQESAASSDTIAKRQDATIGRPLFSVFSDITMKFFPSIAVRGLEKQCKI
jgi:hypothetical protein